MNMKLLMETNLMKKWNESVLELFRIDKLMICKLMLHLANLILQETLAQT
jgi:hypothetical protein